MIIVDSSVWIDYFNGTDNRQTDFLDSILGASPVGTGDLMLTEVLQGFRSDSSYRTARNLLMELPIFQIANKDRAIRAAANYRKLRKRSVTVRKTIDSLIATFCIEEKLPLLFSDKDFSPFAKYLGLRPAEANT